MLDPQRRSAVGVPFDDEPFTDAERRAVGEADEWLKHNELIPHEEVLAEFGFTIADWANMGDEKLCSTRTEG
jgi:hypothetical protein